MAELYKNRTDDKVMYEGNEGTVPMPGNDTGGRVTPDAIKDPTLRAAAEQQVAAEDGLRMKKVGEGAGPIAVQGPNVGPNKV